MPKKIKYSPDNILGWSEYDFAVMQEMLLNTFILNNQRAPDFLITNHNDNCVIISNEENKREILQDKIAELEKELEACKKALAESPEKG